MKIEEISEKYLIPIESLKLLKSSQLEKREVAKKYYIYDSFLENGVWTKQTKETNALDRYVKRFGGRVKYFQESGPCSNWGYMVIRLELDDEFKRRLLKQIKIRKENK